MNPTARILLPTHANPVSDLVLSELTIKRAVAALESAAVTRRREIESIHPSDPKAIKLVGQASQEEAAAREILALLTPGPTVSQTFPGFQTAVSDAISALGEFEQRHSAEIERLEAQGGVQEGRLDMARMFASSARRSKAYFTDLLANLKANGSLLAVLARLDKEPRS